MLNAISGNRFLRHFAGVFALLLLAVFFVQPAFAYDGMDYAATAVSISGSGTLTMAPGERKTVTAVFQNTGKLTWHNYGPGYLSIYTYGPKYRRSVFDPGTWMGPTQLLPPSERDIAPGKTATFTFELHAPQATGSYTETFRLASEERSWLDGGEFTLNIQVMDQQKAVTLAPTATTPIATPATNGLQAELVVLSADRVKAIAGRTLSLTAVFKNTGISTWNQFGLVAPEVALASEASDFRHPSWTGSTLTSIIGSVAPGQTAEIQFAIQAPQTNGNHQTHFAFSANGVTLPDALVQIPVEVTGGAAVIAQVPLNADTPEDTTQLIEQPDVRVGVLVVDEETDNQVNITSHESDFVLKDTEGNLLVELKKDHIVNAYYANDRYYFNAGRGLEQSSYGLRFEPVIGNAVMNIENFDRRLTRGASFADNAFRGVLELRYNDTKDRAWVINELPIEYYLRGLAETSDSDPVEFNKAQVTAARTYAYFHILRNDNHPTEFMDLNSTPSDQLYQGYGREARAPKITQTVLDTLGQVVTYAGQVAVTPYYARSNGKTKNWSEVWWGDQPQARSVAVPCDVGKTQWGHGVGMPQSGAKCMAEDGNSWEEILKYFYTGVDITKFWK